MTNKTEQAAKPLFIPLCRDPYERFKAGEKQHEYRIYGPRWNERTCAVGRQVVLSLGYGKKNRMLGRITSFQRSSDKPEWWSRYFANKSGDVAQIGIEVIR